MERFEVIKKLGRGSYGAAIAAQNKETDEMVVIKKVDMSEMDESERHQVRLACLGCSRSCLVILCPALWFLLVFGRFMWTVMDYSVVSCLLGGGLGLPMGAGDEGSGFAECAPPPKHHFVL